MCVCERGKRELASHREVEGQRDEVCAQKGDCGHAPAQVVRSEPGGPCHHHHKHCQRVGWGGVPPQRVGVGEVRGARRAPCRRAVRLRRRDARALALLTPLRPVPVAPSRPPQANEAHLRPWRTPTAGSLQGSAGPTRAPWCRPTSAARCSPAGVGVGAIRLERLEITGTVARHGHAGCCLWQPHWH